MIVFTSIMASLGSRKDEAGLPSVPTFRSGEQDAASKAFVARTSVKTILLVLAVLGTACTLADGLLTPSVSVTSAVAGLQVPAPSTSNLVIPLSCVILVLLFGIQRFGTHKISMIFAPIVCLWLLLLGTTGLYNVTTHPAIFRAFDISRAIAWFARTKEYHQLANVMLSITYVQGTIFYSSTDSSALCLQRRRSAVCWSGEYAVLGQAESAHDML